ncbi:Protein sickie [Harpegnathos saltator]|uniref:Protein sickie n=1 Tax=Harpegnathos saltator TaxID=610380 RepID=E2B9S3_HARSA|nr:Protein sickie [Harpegnathos saltator]
MGNSGSSGSGNSSSRKARSLPNSPEAHRLPSPYNKQSSGVGVGVGGGPGGGTSIPLPATVAATRRCPPDKVRPAPAPTHQSQLASSGGVGSASSSRSTSPSQQQSQQSQQSGLSFIPQPRSQNSTNRQPAATTPSPRASTVGRPNGNGSGSGSGSGSGNGNGSRAQQTTSPYISGNAASGTVQPNKNSVLDKFKLFNNKEKNQERGKASSGGTSKRTSSSSGFSSARSEHSDSSTSLCDQSKSQQQQQQQQQTCQESPKSRALKSKLQSAAKSAKQASPKTGRKEQSKAQSKIARTKAPSSCVTDKLTAAAAAAAAAAYNNPVSQEQTDGGRFPGKVTANKLPSDKKDLQSVKQPAAAAAAAAMAQPQKINPSVLTPPGRQVNAQDSGRNAGARSEPTKPSPRPKMELPGKIQADLKQIQPQSVKPLPNGLNKELMMHKAILANTNGIIKPSDPSEMTARENDTLDHTLSVMNRANLSDGCRDVAAGTKRKEPEAEHSQPRTVAPDDGLCAPSKIVRELSSRDRATTREEEIESADELLGEKKTSLADPPADSLLLLDEKSEPDTDERAVSPPRGGINLSVSFGLSGKPLQASNSNSNSCPSGPGGLSPGSSIPKPTALVKGTSKPPKESCVAGVPTPCKPKCDALHRKLDPSTVAMVSPMPSISDLMSESSHSNSNSTGQSNSSDSSVIYRPSSESGSEIKTIPNRKIDTTFERMEKVLSESSTCGGSLADDEAEMTVKPMQPLLRGYTPGARGLQTLPSRTSTARQYTVLHSSSHHHVVGHHDYADVDVASGYLSDGEVLRGGGMNVGNRTLSDLCDGYMSEGGASLYARRINPSYSHEHDRYVGGSRRELSGVKELVTSRRVQKRPSAGVARSDGGGGVGIGGVGGVSPGSGGGGGGGVVVVAGSLLGGCSGGNDALAELTIEELASIPAGNHTSANHTGHPSHHKDKHRKQAMAEYANGEKPQKVSSGTSTSSGSSSKVRGVPQSFGYVKRHSAGTTPSPNGVQNGGKDATRTAQVSAVPRTKVKVSGGTQTCTTELQANSSAASSQGHHYKSYSLTGPSASQLSQSVRDRLMLGSQSLPKPGSPEFTALFAAAHHRERGAGAGPTSASFSPRVLKPSDGSLSDTCSNYAAPDLQGYYTSSSPYTTSWMRHSNTYTPSGRSQGMGLCEADSVESLGSHRASLTHARLLMHQRDSTGSPAPPRLNRSNSIRSTKSEKMYPSMLARGSGASSSVGEEVGVGIGMGVGVEPYYSVPVGSAGCTGQHWSQPTSPTPTHTSRQPPNLYQHVHKDDDSECR